MAELVEKAASITFYARPPSSKSLFKTEKLSREGIIRTVNTKSMYVNTKIKILPKATESKAAIHKSEKDLAHKSLYKDSSRYKKLDQTGKEDAMMFSSINPIKQFRRKTLREQVQNTLKAEDHYLKQFYQKTEQLENSFMESCFEENYKQSSEVIVCLLNYAVDFDLPQHFSISLIVLANFYILIDKTKEALFFYNEARQCCILLNQNSLLIESLLGIASCCSKSGLEDESIKILKKALEYSWLYDLKDLELRIYDEIGKNYYHLGEVEKAKKYHHMYLNSLCQPHGSALRNLSKQRVNKSEEIHIEMKYNELNILFLVHLKVPIRSLFDLPSSTPFSEEHKLVRQHFNVDHKYFQHYEEVAVSVRKILHCWFFEEEIDQPNLPETDWTAPLKLKKYAYIDFKLNQHLKKFSKIVPLKKLEKQTSFRIKESLEEKIARKIKEPPMESDWYEKIVNQISRDHKNKLLNVRNAVRMRGFNKKIKPSLEAMKEIYNKFFQKKTNNHAADKTGSW